MVFKRKYPAISVHETLEGQLEVDWEREYKQEFYCPHCEIGILTRLYLCEGATCKLRLCCDSCGKCTCLTQIIPGPGREGKRSLISTHQTLNGVLEVNWGREYHQEYNCQRCNRGRLTKPYYKKSFMCKVGLICNSCREETSLTCQVPCHVSNYRSDVVCPNPLCTGFGPDGQKGWIHEVGNKNINCKCHFCGVVFKPDATHPSSWIGNQMKEKLLPFNFDDDTWDLRHFFDKPYQRLLNFQKVHPQWYRSSVKEYLYDLLKLRIFSSDSRIREKIVTLRQFGQVLQKHKNNTIGDINREVILNFLEGYKVNNSQIINQKLASLKEFLDWLNLETSHLIRRRDFLKISRNDSDWLDEVTRQALHQNLSKIPAPIARHYLVQEYTAARPGDVCQMSFDCLVEENGKWYVKFFQHKTQRWHQILATREIRRVIETQQQWIRQIFGLEYSYLFCHFRTIRTESYPTFPNLKPLPILPLVDVEVNPMVRIIRMLIEKENILDVNGQKPHFTGRITRHSRLQEVRVKYGMEAAQLYADHKSSATTFRHYVPPTSEQVAEVDLPFQELLMNLDNKFLPWQSLPESLLENPTAHELDLEIAPRLVVYGHCALDPKTPCPINLYPKCYGCSSFCPSTAKLPLYERQYQGERQRRDEAKKAGAELAFEEAQATIEAMDRWLPELRRLASGET